MAPLTPRIPQSQNRAFLFHPMEPLRLLGTHCGYLTWGRTNRCRQRSIALCAGSGFEKHQSGGKKRDTVVGFNVHKAVKGHKHFLVSDLMGILMGVEIAPANTGGEREGGKVVLKQVKERYPMLKNAVVYVDTGFDGPEFAGWVKAELGWEVRVVRKCSSDGIACCEDPNPTPVQIEAAIGRAKQSRPLS